jgi:hypothetical protein
MDATLEGYPMRRTPIALALATTLLLGLTAATAMAVPNQAIGDRVNLLDGDQSFPASTPFHIDHGFGHVPGDTAIGLSDFMLDMDGTFLTADFVQRGSLGGDGLTFYKLWFYNFPAGLTGSHVFTRHYIQACDNDLVSCEGNRINTPLEWFHVSATVTFTP